MLFTLDALREHLTDAGFMVTDSGEDIDFHHGQACEVLRIPHVPRFFLVVESDEQLLPFTTRIMSLVWAEFERGQMEFRGRLLDDGRVQIVVVRKIETQANMIASSNPSSGTV